MKIEQLISAVFARKSLWDQNDDCHRNRFVLDKLWDEVAEEMGATREAVRSKWKTLRDTYRKELQKLSKANENVAGSSILCRSSSWTHLRSWTYFNSLSFLRDQFEAGRNGNFEIIDTPTITQSIKRKRSESPKEDDANETPIQLQQEKIKIVEKNDDVVDDEDMHFFKSLLPHVKQLSPQQKMLLRIKLQGIVYDFVYAQNNTDALHPIDTDYSAKYLSD